MNDFTPEQRAYMKLCADRGKALRDLAVKSSGRLEDELPSPAARPFVPPDMQKADRDWDTAARLEEYRRKKDEEFAAAQQQNVSFLDALAKEDATRRAKAVKVPLSFEEYQAGAKKTAIYNKDARVLYP